MTPEISEAIADLQSIFESTGHSLVLIGAFAREVTLDRAIGQGSHRATRDVDAAVRVAGCHVLPALIREHPGAPSTQPNSSPACASIVRTNRPLGRLTPPASRQVPEYGE